MLTLRTAFERRLTPVLNLAARWTWGLPLAGVIGNFETGLPAHA